MTVLLIITAVLAFILLLKFKIVIEYADEVCLTVRVLGIPFRILPRRTKKVRVSRYGLRRMRKRDARRRLALAKRARAQKEKDALKKQRKAERKAAKRNRPKTPLNETVNMILALVKIILARFGRHLHIELTRLRITVATGDAAKTAILWGAVYPAVGALLEVLDRITNLHTVRRCDILVVPDYLAEHFSADIRIAFSLRVWHLLDILFRALFGFLRHKPKPTAPEQAIPSAVKASLPDKAKPTA